MRVASVVVSLCALSLFGYCQRVKIDPPVPMPGTGAQIAENTQSQVSLRITLQTAYIQALANANTPLKFKDQVGQELTHFLRNDWYSYDIDRGDITLHADGGRLAYSVPLAGEVSAGGDIDAVVFSKSIRETLKPFLGTISGSTGVSIESDWSVKLDPTVSLKADKAEISILGVSISVRQKLQDLFNGKAPALAQTAADKAIAELHIRDRVTELWDAMHFSQSVADSPKVWVSVDPQEIRMKSVAMANDAVILDFAVVANTSLFVTPNAPGLTKKPLPALIHDDNLNGRFNLIVPVHISVAELETKVATDLEGKEFQAADQIKMKVSKVSLGTSADRVVLAFNFDATYVPKHVKASGRLYALGRLQYDAASQKLAVADIDYDLETRNVVLQTADWLLKPTVLESARAAASVDIAKQLGEAKKTANTYVAEWRSPDDRFKPTVTVDEIQLLDARVARGEAFLLLRVTGQSMATVTP